MRSGPPSRAGVLRYLEALTFDFGADGETISTVLVYAEPDPDHPGTFRPIAAADMGYEGIACVDDTARAALLAFDVHERTGSRHALSLAKRWLSFVEYMQYADGSFANFIRNASGTRNASGPTSHRGGYWWSVRALWALARAYRITGEEGYLERYRACRLEPIEDGKINAVLALSELEVHRRLPSPELRQTILDRCDLIVSMGGDTYFRDHRRAARVHLWGYHQLHAVAEASVVLERPALHRACRPTVDNLVAPDVQARFWYSFPDRRKKGVCAYTVTPIVQGLAAMYRATHLKRYRTLALQGADWFYGRNDANAVLYDPATGLCRDGLDRGIPSDNFGAESSIEAGMAEMERQALEPPA